MKKIIIVAIVLILSLFAVFKLCTKNKSNTIIEKKPFSIHTEIAEGLFFERLNETEHSIFLAENTDSLERQYIVKDKLIFRFGYYDGYVAYHWNDLSNGFSQESDTRVINSMYYAIESDYITIYDIEKKKSYDFSNQNDFYDYCTKNAISFKWRFSNGFELNNVAEINNKSVWEIAKFSSESLTGFVIKDNKTIFEGYITDVYSNNNIILFRLQIPTMDLLEFRDLDFDKFDISFNKPIGKYKTSLVLLYEDIYYDKYILINATTDEVMQFSDKAEAEKKLNDQSGDS